MTQQPWQQEEWFKNSSSGATTAPSKDDDSSSSRAASTASGGCRISNDPESDEPNRLPFCNQTEYRCTDHVAEEEDGGSTTIEFRYDVEYRSTLDSTNVLSYLQEMILEHVAFGLNLTDCRQTIHARRRRRRSMQQEEEEESTNGTDTTTAFAVSGLPSHHYLSPPSCDNNNMATTTTTTTTNATRIGNLCSGTVQGGITVWAATRNGVEEAAHVTKMRIRGAMGWLSEPGSIERVAFVEFVKEAKPAGGAAASDSIWYQNPRLILLGGIGGGLFCLLVLFLSCCCCFLFCRSSFCRPIPSADRKRPQQRQRHRQAYGKQNNDNENNRKEYRKRSSRSNRRRWETLDDSTARLPIAQRDSLALRPAGSWMMTMIGGGGGTSNNKTRSSSSGADQQPAAVEQQKGTADHRSDATGDLTNDVYDAEDGIFCIDTDESDTSSGKIDQHTDSERLVGVGMVSSSCSTDILNGDLLSDPFEDGGGGVASGEGELPTVIEELAEEEADLYILQEVSSDDDSEVAKQWKNIHCLEGGGGSTEGYDDEIIEVLGHISFGNEISSATSPSPMDK